MAGKTLKTLIKLHRRKLDELRRQMADLENQKFQLLRLSARLQKELRDEIEKASMQPEMGQFFGGFAKRIQQRQEAISNEVNMLDVKMDALSEEISVAYTDLKKYEIAEENAIQREKEEQNRKETIALDELAAQQYRRQSEEQ